MVTRDVFKVLKLHEPQARAILRTLKTSLVPKYHEEHSRSHDFLYLLNKSNLLSAQLVLEEKGKLRYPEGKKATTPLSATERLISKPPYHKEMRP